MNPETPVVQLMRFARPEVLWLLLGVPVALLLLRLGGRTRQQAQRSWAGDLFARLARGRDRGRERFRRALWLLGFTFVVLALARPQWGGEMVMMKRRGIDVLIAMDVSSSMLAEDMRPNRLAAARRAVADLVGRMGGDRIGLIAFAGDAYTVSPLTLDHGTILLQLEALDPVAVSLPGTNLAAALVRARESFVRQERKYKALVLVTDGESTVGEAKREAEKAAEEGIVAFTIGLGSPDGQPIPERGPGGEVLGYKRDRGGKVVNSRLDEQTLREIAQATGGSYFRAGSAGIEVEAVFEALQSLEKKELEGQLATSYEERYQWPLALAALVLGLELVVPNRRREVEA